MSRKIFQFAPAVAALAWLCSFAPALAAAPSIGSVSPVDVNAGTPTLFTVSASSINGIASCNLYIDQNDVGAMMVNGSTASLSYTYSTYGVHTMFVFCKDQSNGMAAGPNTSIFVQGGIVGSGEPFGGVTPPSSQPPVVPPPTTPGGPGDGSLIKLECGAAAGPDDSCKAVYYVAKDGKRHAFPNSKVFFGWYSNFDSVQTVTPAVMGSFALGKNVTYKPGARMVKFATLNNVYAVTKGGTLRWVTTEAVAIGLYGSDWNTKIDDIPDTFYGNYVFGSDLSDATGYNVATEQSAVGTIDDNL